MWNQTELSNLVAVFSTSCSLQTALKLGEGIQLEYSKVNPFWKYHCESSSSVQNVLTLNCLKLKTSCFRFKSVIFKSGFRLIQSAWSTSEIIKFPVGKSCFLLAFFFPNLKPDVLSLKHFALNWRIIIVMLSMSWKAWSWLLLSGQQNILEPPVTKLDLIWAPPN